MKTRPVGLIRTPKNQLIIRTTTTMGSSEQEKIWNCMVIWEAMLEIHQQQFEQVREAGIQGTGMPQLPMLQVWEAIGTNEMRQYAMDLESFVQGVFNQLEMILGDDPLDVLDLTPFDWEYVPYVLNFVTWGRTSLVTPPIDETANRIIAMRAHNVALRSYQLP